MGCARSGGSAVVSLILIGSLGAIPVRAQPSDIVDPWPAGRAASAGGSAGLGLPAPPSPKPGDTLGEVVDPWATAGLDVPPTRSREADGVESTPTSNDIDRHAVRALDAELVDPWPERAPCPAGSLGAKPEGSPEPVLVRSATEIIDPWTTLHPGSAVPCPRP